jgi:polyhydroxybutyrate depolymerase
MTGVLTRTGIALAVFALAPWSSGCSDAAPSPEQARTIAGAAGAAGSATAAPAGAAGHAGAGSGGAVVARGGAGADVAATGGTGSLAGSSGNTGAAGEQPSASGAGAGGDAPDAGPAREPCPGSTSYATGDNRSELQQGANVRRYNVHVPSSVTPDERVPLVLDFHGNGSSGAQEQGGSGWQQKAEREGFIVVFPEGIGNGWNVGNCCGRALSENIDDVGFARAIVDAVSDAACIDPKRIYATGISNGAGLSHRLACEAADVFAAIAAASADLVTDPCTPARPISELSVRGESDRLVAYEGGNTGSTGWYSPGAKGTLELWKNIDGCTGTPMTTLQYCETFTTCSAGVEVTLCSLPGVGHILYDNALGFDVPEVAWEMFVRQTLP